jgi:5-bromo-4-chloroindolyl phosphate hydrolysis protein
MNKLLNNATKEHNVLKNVIEKYANLAMKPNSKSKNMNNSLNNTNLSINQVKDEALTHLSRMSGNPKTEVAEIDLEDFKAKAEELDSVFNDTDIAKLLNFVKEIV